MQRRTNSLDAEGRLRSGTRLGPYEITAALGAGGMGAVYRAVDARLGRAVAIKIMRPHSELDSSRRRRFDREARLASAVNHPHVLSVYDVGEWENLPYVVLELLEGQTLRAHLRSRVLSWRQAVWFGVQIARGLDALHTRGIAHRDLKPENLFVTTDNRIKILDLGLAGPFPEGGEAPTGGWETLTTEGAAVGGTASYMSPEQVRCEASDARSDIFSCGVVLYEMLARRRPFVEDTAAETMTAILRTEPRPLGSVDASLPVTLVEVVERCLAKSPEDRFHSAHDLALALEATLGPGSRLRVAPASTRVPPAVEAPRHGRLRRGRSRAALVAAVLLGAMAGWSSRPGAPAGGGVLSTVVAGEAVLLEYDAERERFAPFQDGLAAEGVDFSRDGQWVAYVSHPAGELWRSRRDGTDRVRLTGPPLRAALPRWSPDGRFIAFAGRKGDAAWRIHLVSADGETLETLPLEDAMDPGWSMDGKSIVYGGSLESTPALFRWDIEERTPALVAGSVGLFSPRPSPDGRHIAALRFDTKQLVVRDAVSGGWTRLTADAVAYPSWTADGMWLHFRREADAGFYRIDPATGREESVASSGHLSFAAGSFGPWSGLTPEGAPLLLHDLRTDDDPAAKRRWVASSHLEEPI